MHMPRLEKRDLRFANNLAKALSVVSRGDVSGARRLVGVMRRHDQANREQLERILRRLRL